MTHTDSMIDRQIQMLSGHVLFNKRRQLQNLSQIPLQTLQTVLKVLGQDINSHILTKQQLKHQSFYNLFYFNPLTTRMCIWNFIMILTTYLLQIQISLTIAFGLDFWDDEHFIHFYLVIYLFQLLLLAIDIFVNINKGYYGFGSGKVISDRYQIIKRYFSFHFWIDIITLIILMMAAIFNGSKSLNFIQIIPICLLFVKKFKCQKQIIFNLQYHVRFRAFFVLLMLGFDVMQLTHFGACIYLGVDLLLWKKQYYGNNPDYYCVNLISDTSSRLLQYIYAQSYATGTLSTLAPGPFGKNPIQWYQIISMTFFMLLASYVAEVLVSVLYANVQTRIFHQNNIQKFHRFMSLKQVTGDIKKKVQNFFELIWQFEIKLNSSKKKQLILSMPAQVRQQLLLQTGFLKQMKFIHHFHQHQQKIQKIMSYKIISHILSPDAVLFQTQYSSSNTYIYFIKSGFAKFYFPFNNQPQIICLTNNKKLLGYNQFITDLSFPYSCRSIDLCLIQKISCNDLKNIIKSLGLTVISHQFQQQLHLIKIQMLLYNQLHKQDKICIICENSHRQNQCPQLFIHYQIKQQLKQLHFTQQQTSSTQLRRSCPRKKYKSQKKYSSSIKLTKQNKNQISVHRIQPSSKKLYHNQRKGMIGDQVAQYDKYYADMNVY